jgi:hypothetical protein
MSSRPRRDGAMVWITFQKRSGIEVLRTAAGLKGTLLLVGKERVKATAAFQILNAYHAARRARIVNLEGKPKNAQIVGLEFAHEMHLRTVARVLRERLFPPLVSKSSDVSSRRASPLKL